MSEILYLDRHGAKVGVAGQRLVVQVPEGESLSLPVEQIDQIVVLGHAHFSHAAVLALLKRSVPVIYSSLRGGLRGMLVPAEGRQVTRRMRQYESSRDAGRCIAVARALVQAKLRGQARLLRSWQQRTPTDLSRALLATHHCADLDVLRGYEGLAARAFFAGLRDHLGKSPFVFEARQQHPPPDPVNALLSLAYTLLMNEVAVGVAGCGLDAAAGFFHRSEDGRPALLMDLMEPLRPLSDRLCARLLIHEFTPQDFESGERGCRLANGRRGVFYRAWEELLRSSVCWRGEETDWRRIIHLQARELARWLDDGTALPRFWHLDEL